VEAKKRIPFLVIVKYDERLARAQAVRVLGIEFVRKGEAASAAESDSISAASIKTRGGGGRHDHAGQGKQQHYMVWE